MKLKCEACGKSWDYKGSNKFKATCPDCHLLVKIKEVNN